MYQLSQNKDIISQIKSKISKILSQNKDIISQIKT
jgi:hypothetical protein